MSGFVRGHIYGIALVCVTGVICVAGAIFYQSLRQPVGGDGDVEGARFVASEGFENLDSGLVEVAVDGDDGLRTMVDLTQTFRELNQGNAVAPLFLLHALQDEDGRSTLELLERFGFMPDGGPREGLPSGFTLSERRLPGVGWDVSTSGFSCTACHSGEFQYRGQRYRVDGMPGLVDIEGWTLELSRVVDRNDPRSFRGGREFMRTVERALRYSYDWRHVDVEKPDVEKPLPLLPSFELADLELLGKSIDELQARGGALFPEAPFPGAGAVDHGAVPFTRQSLSEDPVMRGYQLSLLKGMYREEMRVLPEFKFIDEELKNFMSGTARATREALERQRAKFAIISEMAARVRREYEVFAARYANGRSLITALKTYPLPGYGRDDAWGLIDRMVGGREDTVLDRPISIPPLFGCGDYLVFHIDGNTNSMMDRNIAQAVALGAGVDRSGAADINLREIDHANRLAAKIHGPAWPEFFPPLDKEKVARGRELFEEKKYVDYEVWDYLGNALAVEKVSCADCHATPTHIGEQRYYQVGTSPLRLHHYPDQPGMLDRVAGELERIRAATRKHGVNADITDEEARAWERDDEVWWREQKGYVARALDGIWASPPYLHNGSVPTLHDLFLTPSERPIVFHVGGNEFDPVKVGFVSEKTDVPYRFDTTQPGNLNAGHEFGTELSEVDRNALVEYLKTFSRGTRWEPARSVD